MLHVATTSPRPTRRFELAALAAGALALGACASGGSGATNATSSASAAPSGVTDPFPVRIANTYGTTVIDAPPTRVATVAWTNQDVALALGVLPVGMPKANYGDEDGDGMLPWVKSAVRRLGGTGSKAPAMYDETDSIAFEAVAATEPDVILGAQSGLSRQDYETLSEIAPTVSFPKTAWGTDWRQTTTIDAKALGRSAAGAATIAQAEGRMAAATAKYPQLAGKSAAFLYFTPSDLSTVGVYTTTDARPRYLADLGLATPASVRRLSAKSHNFYVEVASENADALDDVDVVVTYGDAKLLAALRADPLIGAIPAVKNGAVAVLKDNTALAAAASPSVLSIPATVDQYAKVLAAAADRAR